MLIVRCPPALPGRRPRSVFGRQEEGGGAAVSLGDDPEPLAGAGGVGGEEAAADPQGALVLAAILGTEVAPVAVLVP